MTPIKKEPLAIALKLARPGFTLDIDLTLPGEGITVLFGASGSGKTSLLRCVAGLERPLNARIVVDQEVWQDNQQRVFKPTHRRPLGYVFQEASLFDHLDVQGNLGFGVKRRPSAQSKQVLAAAIELLGIGALLQRRPAELSGGERQRVAIARALATSPRLLLLDEPMASLDQARRDEVLPWLERLHDELRLPMLYVTHSANELQRLADHVVVMEQGKAVISAPLHDVLSCAQPQIISGEDAGTVLLGHVAEHDSQWQMARIISGNTEFWVPHTGIAQGQAVRLLILARDVSIATQRPTDTSIQNQIPCQIESLQPDAHPSQVLVRLRNQDTRLIARITRRAQALLNLQINQPVWAQVKSVALLR